MEDMPIPDAQGSYYDDPEIIEAANGDRMLLDRLVGRAIAAMQCESSDEDTRVSAALRYRLMDGEVMARRQELGLPEEHNPGEPQ